MKNFIFLLYIYLAISNNAFGQNYYLSTEVDKIPQYKNNNSEFLADILSLCYFKANDNCSPGSYTVLFDILIGKLEEQTNLLGPPPPPVKVEDIIIKSNICESYKNQIKQAILELNKKNLWSAGYVEKKKRLKDNIPYSTNKISSNRIYSVPTLLSLSIEFEVKVNEINNNVENKNNKSTNENNNPGLDWKAFEEASKDFKEDKNIKNEQNQNNISDKKENHNYNKNKIIDSSIVASDTSINYQYENNGEEESRINHQLHEIFWGLILYGIPILILTLIIIFKVKNSNRVISIEQARIKAENEAKQKVEQEERIKAEQEAKRKAEKDALIKAEQEAKQKVEQEERIKAEQEAKRKAEKDALIKAEQEAKRKAEEEARIKEEQEAKRKAIEEARIKAEELARIELENNSYYYEVIENGNSIIKGPFSLIQMEKLLQKNEISLLTKTKFGLNKKTLKPLKEFKEFTTGFEDFL